MMRKTLLITLLPLLLILACGPLAAAEPPKLSTTVGELYYRLGGGKVLPPPGAGFTTFAIRSRFTAGFGGTCGKFDFQLNVSQVINQFKSRIREIPGQLQSALSAAIAGLPGYLMLKFNPSLYNTMVRSLDESVELFRLSYKTCQQLETEMQKNPGANPYQGFLQASIADKWTLGAESGALAADVHEEIKKNPAGPIRWLGGHEYGTDSNPIQINRDLTIAGYNILIGRTGDVSTLSPPFGAAALEPIVKIWATPAEAGRWIQEVIGDQKIVLKDGGVIPKETIPGEGLRPKVEDLETAMRTAVLEAYEHDDYTSLNQYPSTLMVSAALIDGLRSMPRGEVAVMIDRLASEMAVKEIQERTFLIRQMIDTGSLAPDVITSTGGAAAIEYIQKNSYPNLRTKLSEILDDLELKQRTLNRTTVTLLNRANEVKTSGGNKQPGVVHGDSDYLSH